MTVHPSAGDIVTFRAGPTTLQGRVVGVGPGRYLVRLADGELVPVTPPELGAVVEPEPAGDYLAHLTGIYELG